MTQNPNRVYQLYCRHGRKRRLLGGITGEGSWSWSDYELIRELREKKPWMHPRCKQDQGECYKKCWPVYLRITGVQKKVGLVCRDGHLTITEQGVLDEATSVRFGSIPLSFKD